MSAAPRRARVLGSVAPERRSTARPRAGSGLEAGFSLIELLTVMVVIGILAVIAIPNFHAVTVKARAIDVVGDIEVIEQAARNYQADFITWPAEVGAGTIPAGLAPYLPAGFSFTAGEGFVLDWEAMAVPGGLPNDPGTTQIYGVGVITSETDLADALVAVLGETSWLIVGSTYIRIIDRG